MDLFIRNIAQLVTVAARGKRVLTGPEMRDPGLIRNGAVLCKEGKITWVGEMQDFHERLPEDFPELDADGMVVLPGFVDSHTHMMFAGSRENEFSLRSSGSSYQEIAEQGGGIMSTVRQVRLASKKDLKRKTSRYLNDMLKHGTTTVEIKSGYGLETETELRMLEAIRELSDEEMMTIVPTFIGAHAIPMEYRYDKPEYIRIVVEEMLPHVTRRKLAAFCDVFCEEGYFDAAQSEQILLEGRKRGMGLKVHADELTASGGAELAARVGAVSADHLEHVTAHGIAALRGAGVVATLLPGVSFFLNHGYAPARKLIDAGVPVAIASDFNPGSCMSFSMPTMMTIACTQMHMTPEEAVVASTLNAAAALGLSHQAGSIEAGKAADLIVADVPDYRYLAYHFGTNHVWRTVKNGTILES